MAKTAFPAYVLDRHKKHRLRRKYPPQPFSHTNNNKNDRHPLEIAIFVVRLQKGNTISCPLVKANWLFEAIHGLFFVAANSRNDILMCPTSRTDKILLQIMMLEGWQGGWVCFSKVDRLEVIRTNCFYHWK